jgi:hypothetical protein
LFRRPAIAALTPVVSVLQVSIFSSGNTKGIAQTRHAQVIGRAELDFGPFYVATYVKNVTAPTWNGETAAIVGLKGKWSGFNIAASATLRQAMGAKPGTDATAPEFAASIARPIGRVTPTLSIIYTPDELGSSKESIYVEGGASYKISKAMTASAGIGRRQRVLAIDYTAWNAGIGWNPSKHFTLDARYWDTDGPSVWPYKRRFVVSGIAKF